MKRSLQKVSGELGEEDWLGHRARLGTEGHRRHSLDGTADLSDVRAGVSVCVRGFSVYVSPGLGGGLKAGHI